MGEKIFKPSEEAKREAKKKPNGYVYVIDKKYSNKDEVPNDAILGAWKVDENGDIIDTFLPNPNYKN